MKCNRSVISSSECNSLSLSLLFSLSFSSILSSINFGKQEERERMERANSERGGAAHVNYPLNELVEK